MAVTLGKHHDLVKRLRALRRDAGLRRSEGVFVAEGPHLVAEAFASGAQVDLVVASPKLASTDEGRRLLARVQASGAPHYEAPDAVVASLQDAHSPQPVLAVVKRPAASLDETLAGGSRRPVRARPSRDPGPGKSGQHAAYGGRGRCDGRRCLRARSGPVPSSRGPCVDGVRLSPSADRSSHGGHAGGLRGSRRIVTIGTAPTRGKRYDGVDLKRPLALFVGGEGAGLSQDLIDRLDEIVHVPMRRRVESLSVGAAAAVLLFEAARQRGGVALD